MLKCTQDTDLVIIGAGAVGCAIARHLAVSYPSIKIIVLEKMSGVGMETSKFNSGVLHSGLHEKAGSLKSMLAQKGSQMAIQYMLSAGLPILQCGMIVAISPEQLGLDIWTNLKSLYSLIRGGYGQGIRFKFLTRQSIKKMEPNIEATGGVFIPGVCVIDPQHFVKALYRDARNLGVGFYFDRAVKEINMSGELYNVVVDSGLTIMARAVINSAGLYADEIAGMAGFSKYLISPWRGEYYEVVGDKRRLVNRLVYPVMPENSPSKGIHFSPRVNGRLFVGPNARPVPSKKFYEEDKTPVETFYEAAYRLCPKIEIGDLKWAYSGIRPKVMHEETGSDFIISRDSDRPLFINLIGIDSPGLTASMAIAEYVEGLIEKRL